MTATYTFKRHILVLIALSVSLLSQAQPRLVGMMGSGPNNNGAVIHYTGGDTFISRVDTLTYSAPSASLTMTEAADGKYYFLSFDPTTTSLISYDYNADTFSFGYPLANDSIGAVFGSSTLANNGLKYGLAYNNGTNNGGTIFACTPTWVLYASIMVDLPANANPTGSLIQSVDGNLYGSTQNDGTGYGTIFKFNTTTNTYKVLYNLAEQTSPYSSLLEIGVDTFYGMSTGGTNFAGSIFRFIATADTGIYTDIYSMTVLAGPQGSLILASNGLLYGMTFEDGTYGKGTIFSYNINTNTYDTLHNFGSIANDGLFPGGDLYQASDGNLYGVTSSGGIYGQGAIFQYNISTMTYTLEVSLDSSTTGVGGSGHLTEYKPVAHSILRQPANDTVYCPGGMATFIASDSSIIPASIFWEYSPDSGSTYYPIDSATDTTYTFYATNTMNGYKFRAVFSSGDISGPATLTIGGAVHALYSALPSDTPHVWYITNQCSGPPPLSYVWSWGDGSANSIGDTPSHTYSYPGYYDICVTVSDTLGCTNSYCDSSTYFFKDQSGQMVQVVVLPQQPSGITTISDYHFSIYPNPVQETFTIHNDYNGTLTLQIVDILGAMIKEDKVNAPDATIDISTFVSGIYEVRIVADGLTLKVLKLAKE